MQKGFTNLLSSRSVFMRDIKSFFLRPIPRITTLRGDEAGTNAFTLVELLVVVLIIGILSAIALPQYQKAVAKARVARLLPLMKSIEEAQEVYKLANGEYSNNLEELDIQMPAGAKNTSTTKRVDYEDFSCFLGNPNTTKDSVYCQDNHYQFFLEKYYRWTTFCWFPKTDSISKAVCGALCQTSSFSSVNEEYNVCRF